MNKPELYQKTVDILVVAYFNDTLEHGDYCGCAVGNIIVANMGYESTGTRWFKDGVQISGALWYSERSCKSTAVSEQVKLEIISTGYSYKDILKIERAFETAPKGNSKEDWMFNGLMAVIEVLDQIHGNTDTIVTETTKRKFVKQPA